VNTRPRVLRAAAVVPAALLLLLTGGCSHYHIGIPLVPGLSLGLGATKDGNFSVGLNTGFGPLGAGVAVNNGGQVSGSAGVGVGVGPVGAGVSKGTVLYDPKAAPAGTVAPGAVAAAPAPAPAQPVQPVPPIASAAPAAAARAPLVKIARPPPEPQAPAVNVTYRTPVAAPGSLREAGMPGNPVAP